MNVKFRPEEGVGAGWKLLAARCRVYNPNYPGDEQANVRALVRLVDRAAQAHPEEAVELMRQIVELAKGEW